MRVATWNVNSIRARMERLQGWLAERGPEAGLAEALASIPPLGAEEDQAALMAGLRRARHQSLGLPAQVGAAGHIAHLAMKAGLEPGQQAGFGIVQVDGTDADL